jgi:hypothetical protein
MILGQISRLVPLSTPRADIDGPAFANGPTTLHTSVTRNLLSDRLLSAPMQPLVLVPAGAHSLPQRLTCLPFS